LNTLVLLLAVPSAIIFINHKNNRATVQLNYCSNGERHIGKWW